MQCVDFRGKYLKTFAVVQWRFRITATNTTKNSYARRW